MCRMALFCLWFVVNDAGDVVVIDDDMMRVRECGVQSGTVMSLVCC